MLSRGILRRSKKANLPKLTVVHPQKIADYRSEMESLHHSFEDYLSVARSKARRGLFIAIDQAGACYEWTQKKLAAVRSRTRKESQRIQDAFREKETYLNKLLTDSQEPVVVMNDSRRLLAVNPAGLRLFGISERNVRNFTLDAFLPWRQIPWFELHGLPFLRGRERCGKCQITRLDGSVKTAEFMFQANFIPGRHLSKFHECYRPSQLPPQLDPEE
jgi:PAS domain-containing protein